MKEPKWITIEEDLCRGKFVTKRFSVYTKDKRTLLGTIFFSTAWRRYVFAPRDKTIYEWDCMRDIAEFLEKQTALQKIDAEMRRREKITSRSQKHISRK